MIATYVSAALICAASLLVGRALLSLAGRGAWSWLEPAVGFAALHDRAGCSRGRRATAPRRRSALVLLIIAAAAVVAVFAADPGATAIRRRPQAGAGARGGLPVASPSRVVLSIPFAVSGRWGLLGVGFNNDLGLHLAWAEWLRSGFGPAPDPGYPLGPHGLAVAVAAVPGIGLGQAFVGEIFAIGILTGADRAGRPAGIGPGTARCSAPTWSPSPTSAPPTSPRAPSRRPPRRSSSSRLPLALRDPGAAPARRAGAARLALPGWRSPAGSSSPTASPGSPGRSPIVALWSLTLPAVRRALAPRSLLRFLLRPATLLGDRRPRGARRRGTLVGPFGFVHSFNKVAGTNTYGPVSPIEALGVWPAPDYRLEAAGRRPPDRPRGRDRRRSPCSPAPPGGCAGATSRCRSRSPPAPLLYLAALPTSGDYSHAKALMIGAPLAMLVAIRPLLAELRRRPGRGRARLAWSGLAVVFIGGAALFELPGAARRAGRAARPRRRAAGLPADPARQAGPLRRPGPLRGLRAARRRHPRATGRVPRPRGRARTRRSRSTPATPTARSTSTPSRAARSTASPT